ncbi:MAG: hypothetical protein WBM44_10390 [Waterburya sp.]
MPDFDVPIGLQSSTGEFWNIDIETVGTANGNLEFVANSLAGGTPQMVINDETGNVGIGTTVPNAKLDINGSLRVNNGTIFSRIQAGTAIVGSSGSKRKNVVVNFPIGFSNPPKVIATARGGNFPDTFAVTTTAISTAQFRINVLRLDGGNGWGQNLQLDWFAWQ